MGMIIRFAEVSEYPEVLVHYKACNYNGGVEEDDRVLVAVDQEIIGAVRICIEHGVKVLRGMNIKGTSQKKGIGSLMLKYLADHTDMNGCYCLPYKHLTKFYGMIGFQEISAKNAPLFLVKRLEKYLSSGSKEIVIMMINNNLQK